MDELDEFKVISFRTDDVLRKKLKLWSSYYPNRKLSAVARKALEEFLDRVDKPRAGNRGWLNEVRHFETSQYMVVTEIASKYGVSRQIVYKQINKKNMAPNGGGKYSIQELSGF